MANWKNRCAAFISNGWSSVIWPCRSGGTASTRTAGEPSRLADLQDPPEQVEPVCTSQSSSCCDHVDRRNLGPSGFAMRCFERSLTLWIRDASELTCLPQTVSSAKPRASRFGNTAAPQPFLTEVEIIRWPYPSERPPPHGAVCAAAITASPQNHMPNAVIAENSSGLIMFVVTAVTTMVEKWRRPAKH